jgi:glucose/arabinose dehydrogenase
VSPLVLPPCGIRRFVALVACAASLGGCDDATSGEPDFPKGLAGFLTTETVASGFDTIWELAWGPDGFVWVTERGGTISRVDPLSGAVTPVGDVPGSVELGEGGLMGLAFHPDFANEPWVYVSHTYGAPGTRNRIIRMRYENGVLGPPEVLVANIPGSSIHNGSRLAVGPDGFVYATTGDAADPALAQNTGSLAGKVLRFTLDGQPAPANPFGNLVFSLGHRNPQGIAFSPDGLLYITEHGASDNDEVNLVQGGGNYGWPNVRGRCDGDAGGGEEAFCEANGVIEPLSIWTPTIAPAGLALYDHSLIPQLRGLLFATLKDATLYHLPLSPDGRTVAAVQRLYVREFGRLRAVLIGPDGTIYLGTSNRDGRGSPLPTDDRIIRIRPR